MAQNSQGVNTIRSGNPKPVRLNSDVPDLLLNQENLPKLYLDFDFKI